MKDFFLKNKIIIIVALLLVFCVGFFPEKSSAAFTVESAVVTIIGFIASTIISVLGYLITNVMGVVIEIAQYNDFTRNGNIRQAWVIVRDLCNMFFVLIILVIAFATILRIESYNAKKLLPRLLIMVVLINFSRLFIGLLIDFSQIVMLTFVSAFTDASGNFASMLGVNEYLQAAENTSSFNKNSKITDISEPVIGMILAVVFMIVALISLLAVLAVFVMRIIMLWIYTVLSPLAFLLSSFPGGQKYASQYWGELTRYLVNGPVLAFFIWLALITVDGINKGGPISTTSVSGPIKILSPDSFMSFVLAIGFLMGGLMVSSQIGGIGSSWGSNTVRGLGARGASGVKRIGRGATLGVAGGAYLGLKAGARKTGDIGIGMASKSGAIKNFLGNQGGRSTLVSLGTNKLATRVGVGLDQRQKTYEEKAQKYVGSIGDTRVLRRLANSNSVMPWAQEIKKQARNKAPSLIQGATNMQNHVNNMSKEQLNKISEADWHEVGRSGVQLSGKSLSFMQKDADARGAYNYGRYNAGQDMMVGTDSEGKDLNPSLHNQAHGNMPGFHGRAADPEWEARVTRSQRPLPGGGQTGNYENNYRKAGILDRKQGSGRLGVGSFGNKDSESDSIVASFDKIGVAGLKEHGKEKFSDIKGVTITDKKTIGEVSKKMVGILDSEINKLKSSGLKEGQAGHKGQQQKISRMENARTRFMNPEKMDKLELVNSSARGYGQQSKGKINDIKKTLVEEQIHGMGIKDERQAKKVRDEVMKEKSYSKMEEKVNNVLSTEKKDHTIKSTDTADAQGEAKNLSPGSKSMINNIVDSGPIVSNESSKALANSLFNLQKAIKNQSVSLGKSDKYQAASFGSLGKKLAGFSDSKINPEKTTPLEVGIHTEEIKKQFNEEKNELS